MRISVKVKTRAKKNHVEKIDDKNFVAFVKELPIEGKANEAVVKILSFYLNIAKSRIKIVSGRRSKNKIVAVD